MESWLKIDFHTHTAEDPYDIVPYTARQLVSEASSKGYDALAVTNHDLLTEDSSLKIYAEEKGVILLPGMEANFSKKHVLIINPGFKINPKNRTLEELKTIKRPDNLIIAPHPFYPGKTSLKKSLIEYISVFDAIEFSQHYNRIIDFNTKAVQTARRFRLPLIGSSDSHRIWQFGLAYSLVKAEKNTASIIRAVKEGRVKYHSPPLSSLNFYLSGMLFIQTRLFKYKTRRKEPRFP